MYYIYAYIRSKDSITGKAGTPYYIGKGKNYRAYDKANHLQCGGKMPSDKKFIVIMETGLTDIGACALERFYIRWYGRIDNKTGILRNRTDGGESNIGLVHSEETKRKMSLKHLGRKLSDEHKQKLRVPKSEEYKKNKSIAMTGRKRGPNKQVVCPHCSKCGGINTMKQWHFDNCKTKTKEVKQCLEVIHF